MPGKTAAPHEIPFVEQGDKPPSAEEATKPMAERVHERLDNIGPSQIVPPGGEGDDGKLLIVQSGAPAFAAMKGDATIAEDGTLAIGVKKIVTDMLADLGVTTAKINNKAVTLAKLAEELGLTEGYYADGSVTSRKAKLTAGEKAASESLTLSAAETKLIPGCSQVITPAVASIIKIDAFLQIEFGTATPELLSAFPLLYLDGQIKREGKVRIVSNASNAQHLTATLTAFLPLTVAEHTIELKAIKAGSATVKILVGGSVNFTNFTYMLLAS